MPSVFEQHVLLLFVSFIIVALDAITTFPCCARLYDDDDDDKDDDNPSLIIRSCLKHRKMYRSYSLDNLRRNSRQMTRMMTPMQEPANMACEVMRHELAMKPKPVISRSEFSFERLEIYTYTSQWCSNSKASSKPMSAQLSRNNARPVHEDGTYRNFATAAHVHAHCA